MLGSRGVGSRKCRASPNLPACVRRVVSAIPRGEHMRRPETSGLLRRIEGPEAFRAAFGVSRETLDRLKVYAELLEKWQKTINLVAPSTVSEVWHRHMADSAQLLDLAPAGAMRWVDLGSGAGFPGLVLAIMVADRAGSRVALVESDVRKCAFLSEIVRKTGISASLTVEIVTGRIENSAIQDRLGTPDVISARALASLDKLFGLSQGLFGRKSIGLFAKGREVEAEIAEARRAWEFEYELMPSRTDQSGRVVVVRGLKAKSA